MDKRALHYLKYGEDDSFDLLERIVETNPVISIEFISGLEHVVHNFRFAILRYFEKGGKVWVIPFDKKLTDLSAFMHLKGKKHELIIAAPKKTESAEESKIVRLYDDIPGLHNGDNTAFAAGYLLGESGGILYRGPIHEFAHVLASICKDVYFEFSEELKELFECAKKRDVFLTDYSRVNREEYFAEGVVAYLNNLPDPVFATLPKDGILAESVKSLQYAHESYVTRSELLDKDFDLHKFIRKCFDLVEEY